MSQYAIKPNYTARTEPAYFQDTITHEIWQPDVYALAAHIARLMKRHTLIDIGCGRAHKLMGYAGEFKIVGLDHGDNIQWCKDHYPEYKWMDYDLEWQTGVFERELVTDAVIICADIIEHLKDPRGLIGLFKLNARYAPIVFTTPDRLRMYGYDHDGPPTNPHHTREWTLDEMRTLLNSRGIPITWAGYTASENRTRAKNTMLFLLGLDAPYAQAIEQSFDVEAAR